jgi:hypothetical protein
VVTAPGVDATDDKSIRIGQPRLVSLKNSPFAIHSPPASVELTVSDTTVAVITRNTAIRIRIPSSDTLDMTWDRTATSIQAGGSAAGKVNRNTVSYSGDGKAVTIQVTTDFSANDSIRITGLRFTNFSNRSQGNLQLFINAIGPPADVDPEVKKIRVPVIRTPLDLTFMAHLARADSIVDADPITVVDDDGVITEARDIRLVLPENLGLTWDTTIGTISATGPASGKVDNVIYLDAGKTARVNVTRDLASVGGVSDSVTFAGLRFLVGKKASKRDTLGLSVNGTRKVNVFDTHSMRVGAPTLRIEPEVSADTIEVPAGKRRTTLLGTITIQEDATEAGIEPGRRVAVVIPENLREIIEWDTTATSPNASVSVIKPDSLVVAVDRDLNAGEALVLQNVRVVVRNDVYTRPDPARFLVDSLPLSAGLELFVAGSNRSGGVIDSPGRQVSENRTQPPLLAFVPMILSGPTVFSLQDATRIEFLLFPGLVLDAEANKVTADLFPVVQDLSGVEKLGSPVSFSKAQKVFDSSVNDSVTKVVMILSNQQVIQLNRWFDDSQLTPGVAANPQIRISSGSVQLTSGGTNRTERAPLGYISLVDPASVVFPLAARYFNSRDTLAISMQGARGLTQRVVLQRIQNGQEVPGSRRVSGDLDSLRRHPPQVNGLYTLTIQTQFAGSDTLSFPIIRQFVVDNQSPEISTQTDGRKLSASDSSSTIAEFRPIVGARNTGEPLPVVPSDMLKATLKDNFVIRGSRFRGVDQDNTFQDDSLEFAFSSTAPVTLIFSGPDSSSSNGELYRTQLSVDPVFGDEGSFNMVYPLSSLPAELLQDGQILQIEIMATDPAGNDFVMIPESILIKYIIRSNKLVADLISYPNPFSPHGWAGNSGLNHTTIRFVLMQNADVNLKIYSAYGEVVYAKEVGGAPAGENLFPWSGVDFYGNRLAGGVYFCIVEAEAGGRKEVGKFKIAISNDLR